MEAFLLTIFGIVAGVVVTQIYHRRSSKAQKLYADSQSEKLDTMMTEVQKIADSVKTEQPETAGKLQKVLQQVAGVEFGVFDESSFCPKCHKPSLKFIKWGVGPLGSSNAWYRCTNCNYEFQTSESSGD